MLGSLIGGFIVILIGITLIPMVAQEVSTATAEGGMNVSGIGGTLGDMTGLISIFMALGIAIAGVAIVFQGLRAVYLFGDETADRIQNKLNDIDRIQNKLNDIKRELGVQEKEELKEDDFKEPSWFERKFLKKKGLMEEQMEEDLQEEQE